MTIGHALATAALLGGVYSAKSGIDMGFNQINSSISSKRAWKYAKKAMAMQYDYQLRGLREGPLAQREGFVNAGYNPLLALGSSGTSAGSVSPTSVADKVDNVSGDFSAVQAALDIKSTNAQVKNMDSSSALAEEQAETERAKRVQMNFQNAMYDVQKHLADKDLSTYDRRFYSNLYEQFQRAENYKANSAVSMLNAETNRINAQTSVYDSRTRRFDAYSNRYRESLDLHAGKFGGSRTWVRQ